MDEKLKQNLQAKSTWSRVLYAVLFALIFGVIEIILTVVVVFQFVMTLLTGNTNEQLQKLGQSLSTYLYQITLFLTFNSDDHPYPFGDWPVGSPTAKNKPVRKKKTKSKKTTKKSSGNEKVESNEDNKSEDNTDEPEKETSE